MLIFIAVDGAWLSQMARVFIIVSLVASQELLRNESRTFNGGARECALGHQFFRYSCEFTRSQLYESREAGC
jgi:hypothetical protein